MDTDYLSIKYLLNIVKMLKMGPEIEQSAHRQVSLLWRQYRAGYPIGKNIVKVASEITRFMEEPEIQCSVGGPKNIDQIKVELARMVALNRPPGTELVPYMEYYQRLVSEGR